MAIRLCVVVALAALAAVPAIALAGDHDGKVKASPAKECKAERGTTDATRDAFAKKYGTQGSNYKNALGKCVSQHAKGRLKADERRKPDRSHRCDKGKGTTP
jgi:hypothetical protein